MGDGSDFKQLVEVLGMARVNAKADIVVLFHVPSRLQDNLPKIRIFVAKMLGLEYASSLSSSRETMVFTRPGMHEADSIHLRVGSMYFALTGMRYGHDHGLVVGGDGVPYIAGMPSGKVKSVKALPGKNAKKADVHGSVLFDVSS